MPEEQITLVCFSLDQVPHGQQLDGCSLFTCSMCTKQIWVSPTSLELKPARFVCTHCAQDILPGLPQPPTPAQVIELGRELGISAVEVLAQIKAVYERMANG